MYRSTKTFGHDLGISCAFRQWKATHSHCSKIHGYALSFHFVFEADQLDERNWVMDFGGFKELKKMLTDSFDHKLVVANDDPAKRHFEDLHHAGIADVVILPRVGCEYFAEVAYSMAASMLRKEMGNRVRLISATVSEHGANSATYTKELNATKEIRELQAGLCAVNTNVSRVTITDEHGI